MIAGLDWTVWLLFLAAVGLGLAVEVRFYLGHRRRRRAGRTSAEPDR